MGEALAFHFVDKSLVNIKALIRKVPKVLVDAF